MVTTYIVRAYHDDGSKHENEYRGFENAKNKLDQLKKDADIYGIEKIEIVQVVKETIYDVTTKD